MKRENASKRHSMMFSGILQLTVFIVFMVLSGCGGGGNKPEEFTVVKGTTLGALDQSLAEKGKKVFSEKCAACHKYDTRLVGPPLGTVVKRRTPDYIMSQILHPDQMIANNDTTKALLATYLTQMPNQHLTEPEARAVLEHLRSVAEGNK